MKTVLAIIVSVVFMTLFSSSAFATLSIEGNAIYDDVSKLYWIKDLSLFANQTLTEQQANINNIGNYNSQSSWHMANNSELTTLFNNNLSDISSAFSYTSYIPGENTTFDEIKYINGAIPTPNYNYITNYGGRFDDQAKSHNYTYNRRFNKYIESDGSLIDANKIAGITNTQFNELNLDGTYSTINATFSISPNDELNNEYVQVPNSYTTSDFFIANDSRDPSVGAWVTTASVPTPIPPAFILMGSGLIGLVGLKRRNA